MTAASIDIAISNTIAAVAAPASMEDNLLTRCANGDLLAFRELYDRWKTPLYTLAYRFHGNREDAEDSLQEAFVSMYRSVGSFRGDAKFESWMYRIVMNTCISSRRPRRTTEKGLDFSDEALHPRSAPAGGDAVLRDILESEIALLPELQRAVFLLYAGQGLTHADIATVLRIGVGTSKSYYHRARAALRERLAKRGIHQLEVQS